MNLFDHTCGTLLELMNIYQTIQKLVVLCFVFVII